MDFFKYCCTNSANYVLEYVAYNGVKMIRPSPNKKSCNDSGKTSTTLFLALGGILLLIIMVLVAIILIFQQRNKNLLNQVKHVSFQQTNSNNHQGCKVKNLNHQKFCLIKV